MAKHDSVITAVVICAAILSVALVALYLPSTDRFKSNDDKEQQATPFPSALPERRTTLNNPRFVLRGKNRELFRKFVNLSSMEIACQRQLNFKFTNASLEDVIAKAKVELPAKTRVEVRDAHPARVSCDFKATAVGNVLQSVGALAGCKLWVFDDYLLISPSEKLNASEQNNVNEQTGGEWQRNMAVGETSWGAKQRFVSVARCYSRYVRPTTWGDYNRDCTQLG